MSDIDRMDLAYWDTPKPITRERFRNVNILEHVPPYELIPSPFRADFGEAKTWVELAHALFFKGAKKMSYTVRDGVDKAVAIANMNAILSNWELKHEHKIAATAYLMSRWFITFEVVEVAREFDDDEYNPRNN